MGRGVVVAMDDEVLVLAVAPDAGGRIGMLVLALGIALALDFPDILAGRLVDGHDPVAARMQIGHVQPVAVEDRRDMEAVHDVESSIALLGVELPDFIAVEVEAGTIAGGHGRIDMFPVGTGRSRGRVPLAAHEQATAGAERALPELFIFGADAHEHQVLAVRAGQKNVVAPDGWCGTPHPGQRRLPHDVVRRAPFGRQVHLLADAVVGWAAPLGPVIGISRSSTHQTDQADDERITAASSMHHGSALDETKNPRPRPADRAVLTPIVLPKANPACDVLAACAGHIILIYFAGSRATVRFPGYGAWQISSSRWWCFRVMNRQWLRAYSLRQRNAKGLIPRWGEFSETGKEGAAASGPPPSEPSPGAPGHTGSETGQVPKGQVAKCHVWPSDRFSPENTRFFHLARVHLAI